MARAGSAKIGSDNPGVSEIAEGLPPPTFTICSPHFGGLRFEGRPVEQAPSDWTTAIMFRRSPSGFKQCGGGLYKDGKWTNGRGRPLDLTNLYWVELVNG